MFYDDQDRRVFLKKLLITKEEFCYSIYAYCLMNNHVHMVIKVENEFLSKVIQSLMIRYVQYFNKKYKRMGTLIQGRFKSKKVENQRYFLEICRYVHRNPENAGIAKTEEYEWSSYKEYLGKEKIIEKKILLHYFNNNVNEFINYTLKQEGYEQWKEFAEYEVMGKLTDSQLSNIIMKIFDINDVSEIPSFFKGVENAKLEEYFHKIKNISGTNKNQVARVIRVSRYIIEKIWDKI